MNNVFKRSLALAAGLACVGFSVNSNAVQTWQTGADVYGKVCGHCHETGIGPVIKGRKLPPTYISFIVRNGFRAMPAFRASFIDDASLKAVAEFIQASPAPAALIGNPAKAHKE